MTKKKWSAGFSLVELLLAVAILATLCGFGFVSVVQQRKNLAIMEANETAKEIFLAAQEHLSMAALQGRLHPAKQSNLLGLSIQGMGEDALGVKVKDSDGNAVSYAIFNENSVPDDDAPTAQTLSYSASEVMLPEGSVDAFVLNHRYAVRYNAEAYRTLEVFYTQNDYSFEHSGGSAWTQLKTWVDGRQKVQENPGSFRVSNERPVTMGWYGETALLYSNSDDPDFDNETLIKPSNPQGIEPGLSLINGPVLYAVVALDTTSYDYLNVDLKIDGVDADGAPVSVSIPIFDDSGNFIQGNRVYALPKESGVLDEDGVSYYMVVLDDVTVSGLGFSDMFQDAGITSSPNSSKIIPGSNIQVKVEARGQEVTNRDDDGLATVTNPTILTASSNQLECNSLFADSPDPDNPSSPTNAHITNFRHLQNLSNLDNPDKAPVSAELDQSMYWNTFKKTVQDTHAYYPPDKADGDVLYTPVDADYALDFEGHNHIIGNLEIAKVDKREGNAGVFGTLDGGAAIQNLKLENTTFNFPEGVTPKAAGALVGFGGAEKKHLE